LAKRGPHLIVPNNGEEGMWTKEVILALNLRKLRNYLRNVALNRRVLTTHKKEDNREQEENPPNLKNITRRREGEGSASLTLRACLSNTKDDLEWGHKSR